MAAAEAAAEVAIVIRLAETLVATTAAATTTKNKATKELHSKQKDEIRENKKEKRYRVMRLRYQHSCVA